MVARPPSFSRLSSRCTSTRELCRPRRLPPHHRTPRLPHLLPADTSFFRHRTLCTHSSYRISRRSIYSPRRRLPRPRPRSPSLPPPYPSPLHPDSCPLLLCPRPPSPRPSRRRSLRRRCHGHRRHHHGSQFSCHSRSVDRRKHQSRSFYRPLH